VFDYHIDQILEFGFSMEDLPFPVDNVFLQVKCHVFSYAEVFHRIRNAYSEFVADPEKMVNGSFAREYHRIEIKNIDFLLPEVFCGYSLHFDERFEINLEIVFFCQIKIGRLRVVRLWLRN